MRQPVDNPNRMDGVDPSNRLQPKPIQPHGVRRWLLRIGKMLALVAIGLILVFVAALAGCQRRLIYFPQPYETNAVRVMAPGAVEIAYRTGAGAQKAFYLRPADAPDTPPDRLWVMFCGNASLALHWTDVTAVAPDRRAGYYLVDYPGYGFNEGRPTRSSINEASLAAFDALAAHLKLTRSELAARTRLMCHSLGCAAGLELAARLDPAPNRMILFSPFTSLPAMARHVFCHPLGWLVLDRFDNEARLAELAARSPRPEVTIIHGASDEVIPVGMGRELAAAHPGWIRFHEVPNLDHNWIVGSSRAVWEPLMKP